MVENGGFFNGIKRRFAGGYENTAIIVAGDDSDSIRNRDIIGNEFGLDIDDYMRGSTNRRMAYYDNPDSLIQTQQLQRYSDMMCDAEVRSAINAKRFAVISADWDIVPASSTPTDKKIAEFIKYNYRTCRGTIAGIWFQLFSALTYGYSISEMCFDPITAGEFGGKWRLKQVRNKNVLDYEFQLDSTGNVVELWLAYRAPKPVRLPLWKFLIYTYQPEYDAVFGRSDLRSVHQNWWYKTLLLKLEAVYIENCSFPIRVGKYPAGQKASSSKLFDSLRAAGGNRNTIVVPADFDINFITDGKMSIDTFDLAISYHDAQIEKGIIGQTLTSGESKAGGGSAALGKVHLDTKEDYITYLRVDSEDYTTDNMNRVLVNLNFPGVDEYPTYKWIPRKEKISIVNTLDLKTLLDTGILVEADANILRDRLDLPPNSKFDDSETPLISAVASPGSPAPLPQPQQEFTKSCHARKANPRKLIDADMYACEMRLGGVSYYQKQDKKQKKYVEKFMDDSQPIMTQAALDLQKQVQSEWNKGLGLVAVLAWQPSTKAELNKNVTGWINEIVNTEYREALKEINVKQAAIPKPQEKGVSPTVGVKLEFAPDAQAIENLKTWQTEKDFNAMKQYYADRLAGTLSAQDARGKFWITDVVEQDTLKAAKDAILQTMSNGGNANDAAKAIGDVFRKYGSAPHLLEPARLELIARTNMTRTIADSRLVALTTDPTGEFPGVMVSEVMDEVICEECEARDGEIYEIDDPELSKVEMPLHPNCRGQFIPVSAKELAEYLADK